MAGPRCVCLALNKENWRSLNLLNISTLKQLQLFFELFNLSPTGPSESDLSPHAICLKTTLPPTTSGICNTLQRITKDKNPADWCFACLLVCWYSFTGVKRNGWKNRLRGKKNTVLTSSHPDVWWCDKSALFYTTVTLLISTVPNDESNQAFLSENTIVPLNFFNLTFSKQHKRLTTKSGHFSGIVRKNVKKECNSLE